MVSSTRSQRIPMSSITALTLHSSRSTTSRRTSPIPQLTCKGKACRQFQPSIVQCIPVGSDGSETGIEWKCEAELPVGLVLGEVEVGCEGWAWTNILSLLLFIYALYTFLRSFLPSILRTFNIPTPRNPFPNFGGGPHGGGGGGGGGPGFGGGRGPPPPYTKYSQPQSQSQPQGETWRPGFWSGLATGAAALQGANYLRNRQPPQQQQQQRGYGNMGGRWGEDDRGVGGSGSWGGRTGGGGGGGSTGGGGMRQSTGFGGTRNR